KWKPADKVCHKRLHGCTTIDHFLYRRPLSRPRDSAAPRAAPALHRPRTVGSRKCRALHSRLLEPEQAHLRSVHLGLGLALVRGTRAQAANRIAGARFALGSLSQLKTSGYEKTN